MSTYIFLLDNRYTDHVSDNFHIAGVSHHTDSQLVHVHVCLLIPLNVTRYLDLPLLTSLASSFGFLMRSPGRHDVLLVRRRRLVRYVGVAIQLIISPSVHVENGWIDRFIKWINVWGKDISAGYQISNIKYRIPVDNNND